MWGKADFLYWVEKLNIELIEMLYFSMLSLTKILNPV